MRIYADRLTDHLQKQLLNCYLVFGNEPLLVQESRQLIQQNAQAKGFEEVHRFSVDSSLDWNEVIDCCQSMSLFSNLQLIELDLGEGSITAAIAKQLLELAELINPDVLIVLVGTKLTKAQENAKWYKALTKNGALVSCHSPDAQRLPQFVMQRCRAVGLKPDPEAVQMLAQWHEGNLFALKQSLEKLALIYPDGQLTLIRLQESLSRHNHFTAFDWIDAQLAGKANRAQRILRQLDAEGIESIILMRTLQKELMLLLRLKSESQTSPLGSLYDKYRIWQNRRPLYQSALGRLDTNKLTQMLKLLARAEVLAKTQYEQSPWPLLTQLTLEMSQTNASHVLQANTHY
ncbi:DNA polymerase III subunit delta [Vibrio maerlii]|uniref:DNA polymerase III subunit delta n=1 Tax=Vibrio maerlii TaxID=2231648 RepID=UPI000E3B65CF|nr:DNA polymerase III subunit delta [Vibrio maerlii]